MKRVIRFLFGLMLGAIVGFGLAILFAPGSGEGVLGLLQDRLDQAIREGRIGVAERKMELEQELEAAKYH